MQRRTNLRHNNNEEDEDDDIYASGSEGSDEYSDEPRDSTPPPPPPPPPRSSVRRRDHRPQPQQTQSAPDASVTFFAGASGFEINGGNFSSIGGTVVNTPSPYAAPTATPRRSSASQRKTKTEFFPNASQFKINGGAFTAVNGDTHSPIHINVGPSPGYPPRAPQAPRSQYSYGPPPNGRYPQENAASSSRRETTERRRRRRDDDASSQMQDESFPPNQSHSRSHSAQPSFPTPQFADDSRGTAFPRPSEHAPQSQYPPLSPNSPPLSARSVDPRDQASSSTDRAPPIPVPSTSGMMSTESTSPSSPFSPAMPTSVSAPPSFPRYNNTMVAEYAMDIEEPPEAIRGPAGNHDNVAPQPSGSNPPATTSNVPQSSNPPANKTGKSWMFGKKSGKDKEKK